MAQALPSAPIDRLPKRVPFRQSASGAEVAPARFKEAVMRTRAVVVSLPLVLALTGCASTPGANPHDMSAAQHDAMARRAERGAAEHQRQYEMGTEPDALRCTPAQGGALGGAGLCWSSLHDPSIRHAEQADQLLKAAADHRAASQALRDAEAASCRGVAEQDRGISPFAHRADIASVTTTADSATIVFAPVQGLTADSMHRIVDCHLARNAAVGHEMPEMPWCPLVPNHVTATVSTGADGRVAVTVTSSDPAAAREVVSRAKQLAASP
jgi:hypothetical protein